MASLLGRRSDNIDEDNASDGHGSTITTPVIQGRLVLSEHLFVFLPQCFGYLIKCICSFY
jgi:hypothetical protein